MGNICLLKTSFFEKDKVCISINFELENIKQAA